VPPDGARVRADLALGVDVVTFASPSAVRALATALDDDLPTALEGTGVAAIGKTTAAALDDLGVRDVAIGPRAGMDGLVEACIERTNRQPRNA
jgi:uroporphyrinogen-III synthase